MEMVPFLAALFMLAPIMTGMMAKASGRSYWRWFFVGCIAPAASFFILYWISRNDPPDAAKPDATTD